MDTHVRRTFALLLAAVQCTALAAFVALAWRTTPGDLVASTLALVGILLTAVGFVLAWNGPE